MVSGMCLDMCNSLFLHWPFTKTCSCGWPIEFELQANQKTSINKIHRLASVTMNWIDFRQQSAEMDFSLSVWLEHFLNQPQMEEGEQLLQWRQLVANSVVTSFSVWLMQNNLSHPVTTRQSWCSSSCDVLFPSGLAGTNETHCKTSQK